MMIPVTLGHLNLDLFDFKQSEESWTWPGGALSKNQMNSMKIFSFWKKSPSSCISNSFSSSVWTAVSTYVVVYRQHRRWVFSFVFTWLAMRDLMHRLGQHNINSRIVVYDSAVHYSNRRSCHWNPQISMGEGGALQKGTKNKLQKATLVSRYLV